MFKILNAWIDSLLTVLAADANIPEKGRRIVFPLLNDASNPYFLVVSVNKTIDPMGKKQWNGQFRGKDGGARNLDSDNPKCQTFHFYGDKNLYDWDKEESERMEQQRAQQGQKDLVKSFEDQFKFKDGRVLRAYESKKLIVTVEPTATGKLEVWKGEKLYVDKIDYANKTVDMSPVSAEVADMSSYLKDIPASEVVAGTSPTIAQNILRQPVRVLNPQRTELEDREMAELLTMTPQLNKLAEDGQVSLRARVFLLYQGKGMNGMERFEHDLAIFGVNPEEIPHSVMSTETEAKRRGAYTGTVIIRPPFDPKSLMAEIKAVAPDYQIRTSRDGGMEIDNVSLFQAMMAMGARGAPVALASWLRPRWVLGTTNWA